jgi:hypothetical protein
LRKEMQQFRRNHHLFFSLWKGSVALLEDNGPALPWSHPKICERLKDYQRNTIFINLGGKISRDVVNSSEQWSFWIALLQCRVELLTFSFSLWKGSVALLEDNGPALPWSAWKCKCNWKLPCRFCHVKTQNVVWHTDIHVSFYI